MNNVLVKCMIAMCLGIITISTAYGTDYTCQACKFKFVNSWASWVVCPDDNDSCVFLLIEEYEGEISCCEDNECTETLPYFDPYVGWRKKGFLNDYFSQNGGTFCPGEEFDDYPVDVYVHSPIDECTTQVSPHQITGDPIFCGNCNEGDEEDVVVHFLAIFNPIEIYGYNGPGSGQFDLVDIADCYQAMCGGYDALIIPLDKRTCGEEPCVLL